MMALFLFGVDFLWSKFLLKLIGVLKFGDPTDATSDRAVDRLGLCLVAHGFLALSGRNLGFRLEATELNVQQSTGLGMNHST